MNIEELQQRLRDKLPQMKMKIEKFRDVMEQHRAQFDRLRDELQQQSKEQQRKVKTYINKNLLIKDV